MKTLIFTLILSNHATVYGLSHRTVTRRTALTRALSAPAALVAGGVAAPTAALGVVLPPTDSLERAALLSAIASRAPDATVLDALEALVPMDPSKGRGATEAADLGGEWLLLWSVGAEAFSPLLTLPRPLRPESYQYLGDVAAAEVGEGRVAQGLTGGLLGSNQLWLSSGSVADEDDPSVLDIKPPFRFQTGGKLGTGKPKKMIVEAGSDADFRAVNSRTREAQLAPPNKYKQLYLEGGGPGALRISTITEGDPVIVGAIFVHQKI